MILDIVIDVLIGACAVVFLKKNKEVIKDIGSDIEKFRDDVKKKVEDRLDKEEEIFQGNRA